MCFSFFFCLKINSAISKSKASHRISRKPGLNEVNQFVGYMDNNYKTGEKSRKAVVKAFINKKKKQEKLKNRQLREEECSAETER